MNISGWNQGLNHSVHNAVAAAFRASGAWLDKTTADAALACVRRYPQKIAVVDGATRLTYATLWQEARRIAAGLHDLGLKTGDVISFQLPNWWEAVVINLAASLGGWVVNPIVPIYRDAEVGFILQDCQAKVIFIPQQFRSIDYVAMLGRITAKTHINPQVITVRGENEGAHTHLRYETLGRACPPWTQSLAKPDDVKLLLYTSGTTGSPKGVLHSHNTVMAELAAITQFWRVSDDDVFFMPSPVTHITGYLYALEYVFFRGIKVVLMDRWDARDALTLIQAEEATLTLGATPFLAELTAIIENTGAIPLSLRVFASGGAPVPPDLILRASRALPDCQVFRCYGSSEAPTITLGGNGTGSLEQAAHTDGKIFNHEVRIADPQTGTDLPFGEIGEVLARGPELMLGYARTSDTRAAFDERGFFRTGDLGFVSPDGFLTITGRKKDLIIRGGENLSPKEVEDVLHAHPDVNEAAVVAMPHARLGETACAYLTLKPGRSMDLAQLCAWLETRHLSRQKFPEALFVIDAMPKTASGKILKYVLRERLQKQGLQTQDLQGTTAP